jgi:ceramide glucosyltransferase
MVSCTVFLTLVVVAARRHLRRPDAPASLKTALPAVTMLKPLYGLEPNLESNLRSFFVQDYPRFELIFGARDLNDPALALVRALHREYPQVKAKIVTSGPPDRPNAKICSLEKMCEAASTEYLVISDSDVHVNRNYLREVVRPLLDPKVGLVTCLYRGVPTGGAWSALEAMGMSVEMTSGVVVADMLEGMRFALGPTMAVRRDALERVGGMAPLANYLADDYVLGQRVFEAGYLVVLSRHVIDHLVIGRTFKASVSHQIRWMKSTRFSRPAGHIGAGLTYAMPFGLVGMLAALLVQKPWLAACFLGWAILNRMMLAVTSGWLVVRDARALKYCWLYPLRDFTGFCFWCASFFGNTILWRGGERYRLQYGGKMVRIGGPPPDNPSGTVTVDNLA